MTWEDHPSRAPIGSSKGLVHTDSHPLDIGCSHFTGAVLVLVLAVRTLTESK